MSIKDYKVVCDESNNSPEDIDQGKLVADIYVRPVMTLKDLQEIAKVPEVWDLLWEEVQKEIDREVVKRILDGAKKDEVEVAPSPLSAPPEGNGKAP